MEVNSNLVDNRSKSDYKTASKDDNQFCQFLSYFQAIFLFTWKRYIKINSADIHKS